LPTPSRRVTDRTVSDSETGEGFVKVAGRVAIEIYEAFDGS